MTRSTSSVLRAGHTLRIPGEELVPGDILLLAEGDEVGADARLIESAELQAQEASLTGESQPVRKQAEAVAADAALGDRHSMVFKGTSISQGSARAVVIATGMRTQVGTIAGLLEASPTPPTPLQKEVARVGRMLGIAVVVVATVLLLSDVDSVAGVHGAVQRGAVVRRGAQAVLQTRPPLNDRQRGQRLRQASGSAVRRATSPVANTLPAAPA